MIFYKLDIDFYSVKVILFSYQNLILSIYALYSFINIIAYIKAYILIKNVSFEKKYPRLNKILVYFKKSSLFF